mmetsp:Transcript_1171/g.2457  ORF Transcript_1171/g.2457 Transcript_1171/m.2457 type:complete len:102 (-) Transcript_1171:556-861(-)
MRIQSMPPRRANKEKRKYKEQEGEIANIESRRYESKTSESREIKLHGTPFTPKWEESESLMNDQLETNNREREEKLDEETDQIEEGNPAKTPEKSSERAVP